MPTQLFGPDGGLSGIQTAYCCETYFYFSILPFIFLSLLLPLHRPPSPFFFDFNNTYLMEMITMSRFYWRQLIVIYSPSVPHVLKEEVALQIPMILVFIGITPPSFFPFFLLLIVLILLSLSLFRSAPEQDSTAFHIEAKKLQPGDYYVRLETPLFQTYYQDYNITATSILFSLSSSLSSLLHPSFPVRSSLLLSAKNLILHLESIHKQSPKDSQYWPYITHILLYIIYNLLFILSFDSCEISLVVL